MQNCTKAKNNINVEKRIWKFCNYIKYVQTGGCYGVTKFNWSHTIIVICSIKNYINLHINFYLILQYILILYQILITVNKHNIAFNTKLLCNENFAFKAFYHHIYAKGNRKFIYIWNKFQYIILRGMRVGATFTNKYKIENWKTHIKGTSTQLFCNELYPSQTFVKTKWVLP